MTQLSKTATYFARIRQEYETLSRFELLPPEAPEGLAITGEIFRHKNSIYAQCPAMHLIAGSHDSGDQKEVADKSLKRLIILIELTLQHCLKNNDFGSLLMPGHENEALKNHLRRYAAVSGFSNLLASEGMTVLDSTGEGLKKALVVKDVGTALAYHNVKEKKRAENLVRGINEEFQFDEIIDMIRLIPVDRPKKVARHEEVVPSFRYALF